MPSGLMVPSRNACVRSYGPHAIVSRRSAIAFPSNFPDARTCRAGYRVSTDNEVWPMGSEISLTLACGDYDRTRAIKDGRVKVEGCAINYLPMEPEEAFHRAFKHHEFDASELSFSSYLRTIDSGN